MRSRWDEFGDTDANGGCGGQWRGRCNGNDDDDDEYKQLGY